METKFYRCPICGNVTIKLVDSNVPLVCCGKIMEELKANTLEASVEKHLPVIERVDASAVMVRGGSAAHPMLPEHHICFVCLETEEGIQVAWLSEKPEAEFKTGAKVKAVYAYCNLHGLWKTEA